MQYNLINSSNKNNSGVTLKSKLNYLKRTIKAGREKEENKSQGRFTVPLQPVSLRIKMHIWRHYTKWGDLLQIQFPGISLYTQKGLGINVNAWWVRPLVTKLEAEYSTRLSIKNGAATLSTITFYFTGHQ